MRYFCRNPEARVVSAGLCHVEVEEPENEQVPALLKVVVSHTTRRSQSIECSGFQPVRDGNSTRKNSTPVPVLWLSRPECSSVPAYGGCR